MGRLFDLEQIAMAIPTLDDEALDELARESQRMNEQFQAGLSDKTMMWVILAGIAVFIVLILVHTYDRGEP